VIHVIMDPAVAQWTLDRMAREGISHVSELGQHMSIGVAKDGAPLAGVIFNWYRVMPHGHDMRVIIAADSPEWCLPGVLRELFRYPFEIAGCIRLTAIIRDGNTRSLRLCQGLGFKREGVLRRAYDGKTNAIVLGMLKHECKWLNRPASSSVISDVQKGFFASARPQSAGHGGRANGSQQRGH
jgi:hypothetical protein